jgi:hypothetical protein
MASNRCNSLPATDRALGSGMETESWAILGSAEPWQFKCAQYVKQVYLIESGHRIQCINAVLANPMCIYTANPMCIYTLRFQPFAANLMQHFTIAANHAASSKLVVSVCAELYNVWLWVVGVVWHETGSYFSWNVSRLAETTQPAANQSNNFWMDRGLIPVGFLMHSGPQKYFK